MFLNFLLQEAMVGALQGSASSPTGDTLAAVQESDVRAAPKRVHAGKL